MYIRMYAWLSNFVYMNYISEEGDTCIFTCLLTFLQDLHIDKDPTPLFNIASALMDIQSVYGPIPKIVGKGPNAAVSTRYTFISLSL